MGPRIDDQSRPLSMLLDWLAVISRYFPHMSTHAADGRPMTLAAPLVTLM
jgi:hypothetical protein